MADIRLPNIDEAGNFTNPEVLARLDERYDGGGGTGGGLTAADLAPSALPTGRRALFFGDSHTDAAGSSNATFSFAPVTGRMAGTELVSVIRRGYPGERSDQLLGRLPGLVDTENPDVVFLMCGTNDAGQGITSTAFLANIQAIKDTLDSRGIPLVVGYTPPRAATSDATVRARITAYNQRLYRWATDRGVPTADTFKAVVDPASGGMRTTYDSGDTVHFNDAGHEQLARAIAPVLVSTARRAPWPVTSSKLGLLPDAVNANTGNPWDHWVNLGGTPTSFTYTEPLSGDGLTAGRWATLGYDNSAGTGWVNILRAQTIDPAKISAGDQLVAFFKLKTSGGARTAARWMRGTTTVSIPVDGTYLDVPLSGYITSPYTVTSADLAGDFRFGFTLTTPTGVNGTASMGQVEVYNLTTGGLTGLY